MKIRQDHIPRGRTNRPEYKMIPRFVTIHDTGNPAPGAGAEAHAYFLSKGTADRVPVSWHFTVDDKIIVQHLPLNESGFHAGPGNWESIGVEICMNRGANRAKAEENAAWLTARLLKQFNFSKTAVKQHYDWDGKNCPKVLRGRENGWEEFLSLLEVSPELKYAILANKMVDALNAKTLSIQLKAPVYPRKAFDPEMSIDTLIIAGGGKKDLDLNNVRKVLDASGKNRLATAKNLKNLEV